MRVVVGSMFASFCHPASYSWIWIVLAAQTQKISRPLEPENMAWTTLKNFVVKHYALMERKDETESPVPTLDKGLAVPKWLESLKIHLMSIIGKNGIPLYYVVCPESAVVADQIRCTLRYMVML